MALLSAGMLRPWSRLRIGIGRARGGDLRDARARRVMLPVRRVCGRAGRRALFQTVLVHLCDATRQGEAGLTSGRGGTPGSSTGLRESDAIVPAQCIVSPRPRSSHMEGSSALLAHTCWVQAYHSSAAPTDEKTAGAPIRWAERRDGHRGALQHVSTVSVWPVDRQHANAPARRWCLGTLWRRRVRVGPAGCWAGLRTAPQQKGVAGFGVWRGHRPLKRSLYHDRTLAYLWCMRAYPHHPYPPTPISLA